MAWGLHVAFALLSPSTPMHVALSAHRPRRLAGLALLLVIAVPSSVAQRVRPADAPPVVQVPAEDAAMARAVTDARASLPAFAARLRAPRVGDARFAVKVAVPRADGTAEHVWLGRVAVAADSLRGTLDNDPDGLPGWRIGDRITAPLAAVTDWMFVERGVLRGAYTTRVLLGRLSPKERRRIVAAMGVRLD